MVKLASQLNTRDVTIILCFLRKVRTQLWLNEYCKNISIALQSTTVILITLILLDYYAFIFSLKSIIFLSCFPIISAIIYTLYSRPSLKDSALLADDFLCTKSILITVLELISKQKKASLTFSPLVLQDAADSITYNYNTPEKIHSFRSRNFPWFWTGISTSCLFFTLNSTPEPIIHAIPPPLSADKTINIASTLQSKMNRLDYLNHQQKQLQLHKKVDNIQDMPSLENISQLHKIKTSKPEGIKKITNKAKNQEFNTSTKVDDIKAGDTEGSSLKLKTTNKSFQMEEININILVQNKVSHTYRDTSEPTTSKNFQFTQSFINSRLSTNNITNENSISHTNMFSPVQQHYAITYLKLTQTTD